MRQFTERVGECFVQIGATRDGLDPYIDAAHRRGLPAVLLETPDYLRWRSLLSRREFDHTVEVAALCNPVAVTDAIKRHGLRPHLILAGYERYVPCALHAAVDLHVRPADKLRHFDVPGKAGQRELLTTAGLRHLQPTYAVIDSPAEAAKDQARLRFPIVLKPSDGSSGLGVMVVLHPNALSAAAQRLSAISNYGGGGFEKWLAEEFLQGDEASVQAVAIDGDSHVLTYCDKMTYQELDSSNRSLSTFREAGHIASTGHDVDDAVRAFVQNCIDAVGYRNGPFHLDLMRNGAALHLIEIGFRLSGLGLAELVWRVAGLDWAEMAFRIHLNDADPFERLPETPLTHRFGGQLLLRGQAQLRTAMQLTAPDSNTLVHVEQSPLPVLPPQWRAHTPPSLASDLARHSGVLGRLRVFGDRREIVSAMLHQVLAATRATGGTEPS